MPLLQRHLVVARFALVLLLRNLGKTLARQITARRLVFVSQISRGLCCPCMRRAIQGNSDASSVDGAIEKI
ncbi:hypothetical protein ACQKWADRAFT_281932 [Trichoderma austrokoningii]